MFRYGVVTSILATACVFLLACLGALQPFADVMQDVRFGLTSREPSGNIILVDIDPKSIAALGTWPWNRTVHASIIDRLLALGVAEIAFDVDFSAPSTPEGDAALEAALQRAGGTVVLAAFQQKSSEHDGGQTIVNMPLPRFAANAWPASVNIRPDADGYVRRFDRQATLGKASVPSLASLIGEAPGAGAGSFLVDFGILASHIRHVSVVDLLGGSVAPADVAGRKAIVGSSALELRDFFQVPRYGTISGPLLQALAAESLSQHRALEPTGLALSCAGLCALGLLFMCFGRGTRWLRSLVACVIGAVVIEGAAILVQLLFPVVVDTSAMQVELLVLGLITVAVEIDLRRVRILISKSKAERLQVLIDRVIADNFAGIVVVDHQGTIQAMSQAAKDLLGPTPRPNQEVHYAEVLPPPLARELAAVEEQARLGTWRPEGPRHVEFTSAAGAIVVAEFVATISRLSNRIGDDGLPSPDQIAICLTFQDVTERRRAEDRIAYLAHHDVLTGLSNRHQFLDALHAVLRRENLAQPVVAVLCFDLDRFKLVNDRLGHGRGDVLLRLVAGRLRSLAGPGDLLARLGGDEFAVLAERSTGAELEHLARSVVRRLGGIYDIDQYQVSVGVSVGLTIANQNDATLLLKRADVALYEAKAAGGSGYRLYDAAMDQSIEAQRQLEQDLYDGFGRGEFEVHYQRQVDLRSGLIVGVEALVRWNHPVRGYVSPAEFIPTTERTGLIETLGAWVLRTACKEVAAWPCATRVAVNLSAVQFSRGDLVQTVADALQDSGLDPRCLDLEITETLLMENDALTAGVLQTLRAMGVRLSLDDFGTGYSSLGYIKRFPIDKIKIDQSFARDLPEDQSSIAIIRAVVSLAQSIDVKVTVEGVETEEQFELLRALGCDEVQGYLHGRPEPGPGIVASLLQQPYRRADAARSTWLESPVRLRDAISA